MTAENILEISKYILPALLVFLTSVLTIRYFFKNEQKQRMLKTFLENQKTITPIRLQAYERITLFLERINPEALIMRLNVRGMSCARLQSDMLKTIRAEFDHNLAQQIYITPQSWKVIRNAKEKTIQMINAEARKLKPTDPAIKLSAILLEKLVEIETPPVTLALDFIKKEITLLFGK